MLSRLIRGVLSERRSRRLNALIADGKIADEHDDVAKAISCYRKAVAIEPSHPDALCLLGGALQRAGHRSEAVDVLRSAVAVRGASPATYRLLASAIGAASSDQPGGSMSVEDCTNDTGRAAQWPLGVFAALRKVEITDSAHKSALRICRVLPSRFLSHAQGCIDRGEMTEALATLRAGIRCFPGHGGLVKLTEQIASKHKALDDDVGDRGRNGPSKYRHAGCSADFFVQKVPLTRLGDRMDLFRQICSAKKVLHVGCADHPIFDPENNLHLQLKSICACLDGLDVNEEAIDILRQAAPGRYYTSASDVAGPYDVILVPETLEHVGDVQGFLDELASIPFDQCLITVPNAFLPRDNGNSFEGETIYVEHVHPDHNYWFSPYTLRTCINKYTPWAIRENFLVADDTVVACLCDYRPNWELKRIPKKIHFYWGNDRTSFLRYLSVWSFRKFNPEWEINLYLPTTNFRGVIPWSTGEGYDGTGFTGLDYSSQLFSIPGLRVHEVDFGAFPEIAQAPENYKSDFFRWHILSEAGGIYSDIDLLYIRPMTEFHLNERSNRDAEVGICLQHAGNIIGFLMGAPGSPFYRQLLEKSTEGFSTRSYQAISAPMMNKVYPSMESIHATFPDLRVLNMSMNVVYALDHSRIPDIFLSPDLEHLKPETIGIHWYAGHPVAQEFNNLVTSENFQQYDGVLFKAIQRIYSTS